MCHTDYPGLQTQNRRAAPRCSGHDGSARREPAINDQNGLPAKLRWRLRLELHAHLCTIIVQNFRRLIFRPCGLTSEVCPSFGLSTILPRAHAVDASKGDVLSVARPGDASGRAVVSQVKQRQHDTTSAAGARHTGGPILCPKLNEVAGEGLVVFGARRAQFVGEVTALVHA